MIRSLFKHSGLYFAGLATSKVLSLGVFVLTARVLLPTKFGQFTLYLTLLQVVTFFADFGLVQTYLKKVHEQTNLFEKIVVVRLFMYFASLVAAGIFLYLTATFNTLVITFFLATLLFESLFSITDGYYIEKKKSYIISLKIMSRMGLFLLVYFLLHFHSTLEIAAVSYLISSLLTVIWYFPLAMLTRLPKMPIRNIISLLRSSRHYALLTFTSFAYSRGDSLAIGYVAGPRPLGIYSSAYRALDSLNLLPLALSQNLFPISAQKGAVSVSQLKKITILMSCAGIIFAAMLFIFAPLLVLVLLGSAYQEAIPILQVLSLTLFLFFTNSPLTTVVQSSSYVRKFLPFGIANTLANIALNVIFVPIFGIIAAAWIMVLSESIGFLINLYFVLRIYAYEHAKGG